MIHENILTRKFYTRKTQHENFQNYGILRSRATNHSGSTAYFSVATHESLTYSFGFKVGPKYIQYTYILHCNILYHIILGVKNFL